MDRISRTHKRIARLRPSGFWPGFIVGLAYFSYIFRWLWPLYPLTSFGIESRINSLAILLFLFSVSVIGMALFWGLFSFLTARIIKNKSSLWIPSMVASIFVLAEYLRSWGFGLIWFGSGSLLGPHWTLGNLAYLFVSWPFTLKIASVWGIYGIDFLLIWTISIIFLLVTGKYAFNPKTLSLNIGLIILALFLTIGLSTKNNPSTESPSIKVALIQTKKPTKINSSSDEILDDYTKKLELIKEAAKNIGEGIIVFPESSNFSKTLSSFLDDILVKAYFNRLSDKELLVVDNNILSDQENYKSRTLFINSKNGISGFYDKQLLTPAGEYLPNVLRLLLFTLGKEIPLSKNSGLKTGIHSELLSYKNFQIQTIACSDVLSPGISSNVPHDLLLSLQNLGLFEGGDAIASQFLSILRFRAAENGKYAVLVSNFGRSYIINTKGQIEKSTPENGYQILTAEVVPNKKQTWYNKLGDLPILLLSLAVFCYSILARLKHGPGNPPR